MKIVNEWPPIINRIKAVFDLEGFNPVFTFGDKLYNPMGYEIPKDLMIHEEVHEKQQTTIGVDKWWDLYLQDPKFRLEQEIEAYQAQYAFIKEKYNRHNRMPILKELATNLSSRMYGNLINFNEAKEIINVK